MVSFGRIVYDSFQGTAMGMMDGIITVLGIVMGVGAATGDPRIVIISGLVGGVANSIGTSVGFYTSENAERGQQICFYEKEKSKKTKMHEKKYIHSRVEIYVSTLFSFLAAMLALILPLSPFFFGLSVELSMILCFAIAMLMLLCLGWQIGKINKENNFLNGFKYAVIGALSSVVAYLFGELLKAVLI